MTLIWNNTEYNRRVTLKPWGVNGFYVDVPDSSGNLNCVLSKRASYAMNKVIAIRYFVHNIEGNPKFTGFGKKVQGGLAPNFRPMLTAGAVLDNRWYPSGTNCGFLSKFDAPLMLLIPIKPDCWQDVDGKPATENVEGFKEVVTNKGSLCMVFGWQNYFAHGIYMKQGKARFGLWDFKIL